MRTLCPSIPFFLTLCSFFLDNKLSNNISTLIVNASDSSVKKLSHFKVPKLYVPHEYWKPFNVSCLSFCPQVDFTPRPYALTTLQKSCISATSSTGLEMPKRL